MESKSSYENNGSNTKKESKSRDIIEIVECHCESLDSEFEDFVQEYYDIFEKSIDMKVDEEHPIEFNNVYQIYLKRFGGRIEDILEKEGFTIMDFYNEAKIILDTHPRFSPKRFFVQTILAASDYDLFFTFMQDEVISLHKLKNQNHK